MSNRGILFLFSVAVVLSATGLAIWLIASGQVRYVDGLFLLLTCLVIAAAFGLYLRYVIRSAIKESAVLPGPAKAPSTARAKSAPAQAKQAVT